MELTDRQRELHARILEAIGAGAPCPTNAEFTAWLGVSSTSTVAEHLGRLEARSVIRVARTGNWRVITDVETGESTAQRRQKVVRFTRLNPPVRRVGWQPKTCQWIHGDPRDRDFCGKPTLPGSSYCREHYERCYIHHELSDVA